MSAGVFEIGRYECDATAGIHPIRTQIETKALAFGSVTNAYPTGAADSLPSAQVSKGRRAIGINARTVTIKFPTAAPAGYKVGSPITLPWFASGTWNTVIKGTAGTYLASDCELVGWGVEKVN